MKILKNKYTKFFYTLMLIMLLTLATSSCKKPKKAPPTPETGTVIDQQGRSYKTVKIGSQWWMAEDLAVTKYRDGSDIPKIKEEATSDDLWKNDSTGAYCSGKIDGAYLYNWYVINNPANIAPLGWHIPSDEEWKELEQHLGMAKADADKVNWRGTNEGEKMKEKNIVVPACWNTYSDVWATNESGFSALAPGCRMFYGKYGEPGKQCSGFWWSSTANNINAWYRYLDYKNANIFRFYGSKNYGFSVRCVLDR